MSYGVNPDQPIGFGGHVRQGENTCLVLGQLWGTRRLVRLAGHARGVCPEQPMGFGGKTKLASNTMNLCQPWSGGYFSVTAGTSTIAAATLSSSAAHIVAAGAWSWTSYDGLCTAVNATDFVGGGLTAKSPPVTGTTTAPTNCQYVLLTNAHIQNRRL